MKFTVNWLQQYVEMDLAPSDLAERLTMLGLEVDAVEELADGLDKVVVARIASAEKHPNADKLSVCQVDFGGDENAVVVCGAPNARSGLLTAMALPGARLKNGLKVKKAKIRGQASAGMLCSERDLSMSEAHEGIMELSGDLTPGQPLQDVLGLDDTLIEVDLTPNRPDCTSVIGVAREVAGITGKNLKKPVGDLPQLTGTDAFSIEVKDPDLCPRYAARLLKDVKIGPSPTWLQTTLQAVGLRPINNVVDITNFVMLEYGQPLHAFDFAKLAGSGIVVRRAAADEKMTTLDGQERTLDDRMLLICDKEKPVAVAGVMGGENSEVSDQTCDVLLESAYFDPISIRRTARNLNLHTDASYRFERGIDPQLAPQALERAVQLICELCDATLIDNGIDCCQEIPAPAPINLRVSRTNDLLGMEFTAADLHRFLNGIEIATSDLDGDTIEVQPPSFRVDLEREVDLIEEIARLQGYNEIPTTLPVVPMSFSEQDRSRQIRLRIGSLMTAMAFTEAINYSFISSRHFDMLAMAADDPLRTTVDLLNPLTEDQGVMRTTLLPGLLENIRHNLNRQNIDGRLFEVGKVFLPKTGQELPEEVMRLAAVLTGRRLPGSPLYHHGESKIDSHDLRGAIEQLLAELRISGLLFEEAEPPSHAEQFVAIKRKGALLGGYGKISPTVLKSFGIKQDIYFLDLDIDQLLAVEPAAIRFTPLSKFPAVKWDLAVVVSDQVGGGDMIKAIMATKEPYVTQAEIFDVYRGDKIDKGKKSVAIRITYHSEKKTLDDDMVGAVHQRIIDTLLSRFDGQLREM